MAEAEATWVEIVAVKVEGNVDGVSQQIETAPTPDAPVSVKITDLDPKWVSSIKQRHLLEPARLKVSSTRSSCSIHRVPQILRQHNEKAYAPQIISIGPLHYNKRSGDLQAMEEHKWRYLHDVLTRNGDVCLEEYLIAVKELEERARECYSENIDLCSNSFVEMMVLDGFFIIEFIRRGWCLEYKDDPIFELGWLTRALVVDLMMQENQIPFFILQRLFDLMKFSDFSLVEGALYVLGYWEHFKILQQKFEKSNLQIQHLLHLLHTTLVSIFTEKNCKPSSNNFQRIHSASQLRESGIKFRKGNACNFMDIKYRKGVIEIPKLKVEDKMNTVFLNLVAFEQCYCYCKKFITVYVTFIGCLIDTSNDVGILCQKGIIENWLGSDKDAAALFNKIGRELIVYDDDFHLVRVCKEINRYCETLWPRWKATLVRDYFKSPWAAVSFLGAVLLLLLALTQTIFSVFPSFAHD